MGLYRRKTGWFYPAILFAAWENNEIVIKFSTRGTVLSTHCCNRLFEQTVTDEYSCREE